MGQSREAENQRNKQFRQYGKQLNLTAESGHFQQIVFPKQLEAHMTDSVIRDKVSGPLSGETGNKSPLLLPVSSHPINSIACELVNTVVLKHDMLISVPSARIH